MGKNPLGKRVMGTHWHQDSWGRMVLRLCRLRVLLHFVVEVISTSFVIVGRQMMTWGPVCLLWRINVRSYGSNLCQDEDLPIVCLHRSSWSVVLRKSPPVNFTMWFMPGQLHTRNWKSSFQDENPRSGSNRLCLAMVLLKSLLFYSEYFLQSENLKSMIGRWWRLCIVSFLEASLLEKLDFWCYLGGVSTVTTKNWSL
jgi:hypothetical protein